MAFLLLWTAVALTAKRTELKEDHGSRALHILIELAAFYLLWPQHFAWRWPNAHILPDTLTTVFFGWVMFLGGLAFALWARSMLGRNWSANVTIKVGHTLIRNGPYGIVRRPIYTGLLTAMLGTAIIENELHTYLAVPIALLGWKTKSLVEERFMQRQFGHEYLVYQHQVKGIVPYLW